MDRKKGMAYCGLACSLCNDHKDCPGCKEGGCSAKDWCKIYNCCKNKNIDGCYECDNFPCDNPMLAKIKIRTFTKFMMKYGKDKLEDNLERNEKAGIVYHYDGQIVGDYDMPKTEEPIIDMIMTGKKNF